VCRGVTSLRVPVDGSALSSSIRLNNQRARIESEARGMVIMGLIEKAESILTPGGVSHHGGHESPPKGARAEAKAAKAQAELAEAETEVAKEQAAAIARAMQEDEAHRQADLEEVAEKEAEAVPWDRSGS